LVYGLKGDLEAAERLGRADLDEADLRRNLAYFATVRGLRDPAAKAAALAPSEDREPIGSETILPAAGGAMPQGTPGDESSGMPRPLTPAVAGLALDTPTESGWFVDLGTFLDAVAAAEQWRALVREHGDLLEGMTQRVGSGEGSQALLAGPLADTAAAATICAGLGSDVPRCSAVRR
jgi:hypothetical protein